MKSAQLCINLREPQAESACCRPLLQPLLLPCSMGRSTHWVRIKDAQAADEEKRQRGGVQQHSPLPPLLPRPLPPRHAYQ